MVIHLIAPKNKNKWPPIWEDCYNYWVNSPYTIKLWNDEEDIDNILKEDNLDFFNLINQLPKIFKLDYVRPILLKKYGGMYIDMDIEILFDFIPQFNPNIFYVMGGHKGISKEEIAQNSLLVSPTNTLPLWDDLKNYYNYNVRRYFQDCKEPYSRVFKGQIISETVGSIALSRFIKSYKYYYDIEILNADYFNRGNKTIKFSHHHQTHQWFT
jgi:hypothetical protein